MFNCRGSQCVKRPVLLLIETHLTATGCHLPYGISVTCQPTQVTTSRLNPAVQPDRLVLYLPTADG